MTDYLAQALMQDRQRRDEEEESARVLLPDLPDSYQKLQRRDQKPETEPEWSSDLRQIRISDPYQRPALREEEIRTDIKENSRNSSPLTEYRQGTVIEEADGNGAGELKWPAVRIQPRHRMTIREAEGTAPLQTERDAEPDPIYRSAAMSVLERWRENRQRAELIPLSRQRAELILLSRQQAEPIPPGQQQAELVPFSRQQTELIPFGRQQAELIPLSQQRNQVLSVRELPNESPVPVWIGAEELDRAVERDARRYSGTPILY